MVTWSVMDGLYSVPLIIEGRWNDVVLVLCLEYPVLSILTDCSIPHCRHSGALRSLDVSQRQGSNSEEKERDSGNSNGRTLRRYDLVLENIRNRSARAT